MNAEYIQNLRYKLQRRVRRLNSSDHQFFHYGLKQFWGFLHSYSIFVGILEDLAHRHLLVQTEVEKIFNNVFNNHFHLVHNDETECAAASYFIVKKCIESDHERIEVDVGQVYYGMGKIHEALETFKFLILEPLYEYIDEQLDDQKLTLSLIKRYKHKCEWFQRQFLYDLWNSKTQKGEKLLALHLYEYLHDQGLDFAIEPWSIAGNADLVASQEGDAPFIADAKIFNSGKGRGKEYIAKGFNQIYQYTLTYNQPFGYLIIYKTCEDDLRFSLTNQTESTQFVVHNNKTIFVILIDIFIYEKSASKRGSLKAIEIIEEYLVKVVEEASLLQQDNP
jgi:hypothetical protein